MDWRGPILTDSGGFQVMSLAKLRRIDADGVTFQSHIDGSTHRLTPARSMEIQHLLGATITMAFDECTPFPATDEQAAESMRLTTRWAAQSKEAFVPRSGYALFGIVQGSVYPALRIELARALQEIGFDGYAVGGLAVGEGQEAMFGVLDGTMPLLPSDRPRYLMGVGTPADIVGAVRRGIDMFDCVIPTRSGRMARAYTSEGVLNLRNARFADDPVAARSPLRLSGMLAACAGLSASSVPRRRDARADAADMAQPDLLSRPDAAAARRHHRRKDGYVWHRLISASSATPHPCPLRQSRRCWRLWRIRHRSGTT